VLVTSVMTWINTPKKLRKNFPKNLDDEGATVLRDDESDSEADADQRVLYFTDKDVQQRAPPPKYQQLKTIETLAMAAQRISRNLKVYVVCSGLLYGNGESNDIFYEFFRSAWLSLHPDLASLPIVGTGRNRIPTIHVTDLARAIKYLLVDHPVPPLHIKPQQYFIAVDQAR
jgi:nucleoside-diphosphate-sugar epimerase